MAKRSKELFELLREQREAAEAVRRAAAERQTERRSTHRDRDADDEWLESDPVDAPPSTRVTTDAPDDESPAHDTRERDTTERPSRRREFDREFAYDDAPRRTRREVADDADRLDDRDADVDHDDAHEDERADEREHESLGKRRVSLSLNFVLFFVVAFLLTNVMSYLVGSMGRGDANREAALSVKLNKLWAVQVTPLLDVDRERSFAWELRDLLIGEGFSGAEVHWTKLNNRSYLRTIASKHTDKRRCAEDARRLDAAVSRLIRSGKLNADNHPIEISVIPIQETDKSNSRNRHVDP